MRRAADRLAVGGPDSLALAAALAWHARRSAAELTAASAARYGTPAQQTEQQLRSVIWGEPTTHGTHDRAAPAGDRAQFGRKPARTHHTDTDAPDDPSPH